MAKKTDLERQLEELSALHVKGTINGDEYQTRRAALLSAAPSQVVVKKGGFPLFRIGCLGLIAVVVVVIVIAAVSASSGDDSSTPASANGTPQVGTNKGDVHVPLSANSSGVIAPEGNGDKKSKVTILEIKDNVVSTNEFEKPAAGKRWWGVNVQVENVGTAEVTSLDWKLRDSKDGEHSETFVIAAGQALEASFNLTPGGKQQGWIYFEVDSDAKAKWLRADPNFLLKNDLYFDAP